MRTILTAIIILSAPCLCLGANYDMIVATGFVGSGLIEDGGGYRPAIHDDYPCLSFLDITKYCDGCTPMRLPSPNVYLLRFTCDNATAWQIIADGSYLVLQSTIIQPGGPGQEPVTPQPELTLPPTEVQDSTKLGEIAAALAGYSMVYDENGTPGAIPPCPEGSSPFKCNQLNDGAKITSMARVQSDMAGKSRAEIVEVLKEQMRSFPRQGQ